MKLNRVSVEKMKYKTDSLPYGLILLGLVANTIYFIFMYENNHEFFYSLDVGISVIFNLLFLLAVFLCAEYVKNYHRVYAIAVGVIGVIQIIRVFSYPLDALNAGAITQHQYILYIVLLITSAVLLIAGSIISIINSTVLKKYIEGKLFLEDVEG